MANIALTSIGVKVSYCVEVEAGVRPVYDESTHSAETYKYTHITGLRSTPDFNQAPNTADATTFDNEKYTTKVALLRELPDTLEFNAVLGQEFFDNWGDLVEAFDTAKEDGKSVWFCIDIPGLDKSMYFTGEPISMGLPAMEQNTVIESPVYIVPTGEPELADDPTYKA